VSDLPPEQPYDVFLCHNSHDKAAVRIVNEALRQEYNLNTFLDEATLVGGEAWEQSIQAALARAKACAVIVGPNGWGEYQLEQEVRPAVRRRSSEPAFRVIPVLLPGVRVEALGDFAELFSGSHWVTFQNEVEETSAIRALAYSIRGENAYPEGQPRLTLSRVRFDAIRWEAGTRRDESLLYTGQALRDAKTLLEGISKEESSHARAFLSASERHNNQRLAGQLAGHASALWSNPRQRDLAARLALESVLRCPTSRGLAVLRQAYANLHTVRGRLNHPAPLTVAASDETRQKLATGCSDGSVCLWDGQTLALLGKHDTPVRAMADLGGGRFVTVSDDGTLIVWDWQAGQHLRHLWVGSGVVKLEVCRAAGGAVLLTSSGIPGQPGEVTLWNVGDWTQAWRTGMVTDAALDATVSRVVLAWGDHVAIRDVSNGALLAKQALDATVVSVAAHPVQPLVAANTFDRRTHLVSFASGAPEHRVLGAGSSRVGLVRFSPDGLSVAAIRDDFRIAVWNLADGTLQHLKCEGLMNIDIRFSNNGQYLGVISPESTAVMVWRLDIGQHVCTIEQDSPTVALFDDDRNGLWTASEGSAALYVQMPRQDEALWTAVPGITSTLAFSPGGSVVVWTGTPVAADLHAEFGREALCIVDARSGAVRVDARLAEWCNVVFDSEGTRVAAVGLQGVRVWDLESGNEEEPSPSSPAWAKKVPENDQLVTSALLTNPRVADACRQHGRVISTLASRDRRFVAIDHGRLVSLWDASAGSEIVAFSTAADKAGMVFSPGGELFAAGDAPGGVRVYQTDGNHLANLQHEEPISHLAFSPDASCLAIASRDSAVRVWIVSPALLAESVKAKVTGPLSADEWTRYLGDEPLPSVHPAN
jgi:WD40 repeat protein